MKAVIQRVDSAQLTVDGAVIASIGKGLAVYLGVEQGDADADAVKLAQKLCAMRIFSDGAGKMNLSVSDVGGSVLLVSNFTLCADISHGNRPSFSFAMRPPEAEAMFDRCAELISAVVPVQKGIFGADMYITQVNAGPVTVIYDL